MLEKFRAPPLLHAEGRSYEEIAGITDAGSVGVVRSRVCVAKSMLRRRLRTYLAELVPA